MSERDTALMRWAVDSKVRQLEAAYGRMQFALHTLRALCETAARDPATAAVARLALDIIDGAR